MRLLTIEELSKADGEVRIGNVTEEIQTSSSRSELRRVLRGRTNTGTLINFCETLQINYSAMVEEMVRYIQRTVADELRVPTNSSELGLLPVEQFTKLEIPVPDFQSTDVFQIHRARCTGTNTFRNAALRNDWIWIQVGGVDSCGDLRGRCVARLLGLFKIRNVRSKAGGVTRLALVQVLDPVNSGRFYNMSGHIRVCKRSSGRDMRIVNIGVVIG
ncbi:unnamed protein product, partial [Tuber aestivum]